MLVPCLAALDVTKYSATFVLTAFAAVGILAGLLYQSGLLGLILRFLFYLANSIIYWGSRAWARSLSRLQWYGLAGILVGLPLLRWPFDFPPVTTALLGA